MYTGDVLVCVESFGEFKEGMKYYCFADEGDSFWIFAPWLEETLGVNQIKVSNDFRRCFDISY